ncbi:MAG: transcriptional repressor, partial [SAR324 cluster bacterium]|nr:transcriptional repressor [SAR324 cluster bacterium]
TGSYYEHVHPGEHHDHLICTQCGNVIEFHNEKLENMQAEICNNFDFQETHHSLRIFGLCSKCGQISQ